MQPAEYQEYELTPRQKLILKTVIDAYITTGEPVGSKFLTQNEQLTCSSATIRSEMAELEAMGLLEQPHTSAGRVPSEKGYRVYVNTLLREYRMTAGEIEAMNASLRTKMSEMAELLREASRIAASVTNYAGIAMGAPPAGDAVVRFEGVKIDELQFLLVMVLESGVAKTRTVSLPFPITDGEREALVRLLSSHLVGVHAEGFHLTLIGEMERLVSPRLSPLVSPLCRTVFSVLTESERPSTAFEGVSRLLEYPEYADRGSLRNLLSVFEGQETLQSLLPVSEEDDGETHVYIGRENQTDLLGDSTLVYRSIKREGRVVGVIGIIGPRRMDYSKVIATIEELANGLDGMLNGSLPRIGKETDEDEPE